MSTLQQAPCSNSNYEGESLPLTTNPLFRTAFSGFVPPPGCPGGFSVTPSKTGGLCLFYSFGLFNLGANIINSKATETGTIIKNKIVDIVGKRAISQAFVNSNVRGR